MKGKKVLFVDDEEQILNMLKLAFEKKGYVVRTVLNAAEAKIILKVEKINVVFLDLNMPGTNGVELCKWLKSESPVVIAHAITGFGRLFELFDCREAGFEDYFLKPVNLSQLFSAAEAAFEKLDRWFDKRGLADAICGVAHTRSARILFLISTFLYWVSLYLYMPTLPTYVLSRTSTLAVVGTVLSMYGLWQALLRIPVGVSVDKIGSGKYFIVVGMLISSAGAVVMGFGTSFGTLVLGRALTGVAAATWAPLIGVFAGLFSPVQAVFATSLLTFAGSIGRMLATSLTGFLNSAGGYPLAFFLAGGAGALGACTVMLTKVPTTQSRGVTFTSIFSLFRRVDVMLPAIISLIGQLGTWAITFSFMPILASQLGATDVEKSLLLSLNLLLFTAGNFLNTLLVKKLRPIYPLMGALILFTAGIILMAALDSLPLLFVATGVMGLANGFSYPTLMGLSIKDVDQARRTSAMGIHQSVYAFGMFGGPWIGGMIADSLGVQTMFAVTGAFVGAISFVLIIVYRKAHSAAAL